MIADSAQFKFLGHNEQITALATLDYVNPQRGNEQTLLISSSKDGLLKFWDLEQQTCLLNTSDEYMSKIEGFCLIPELNLIVAGSSDNQLKIFKLKKNKDTGALECNFVSTIKKDSGSRVLEMSYSSTINHMMVLSSDNKLELIKVNLDNKDSILKKLLRHEKRKQLKRKREDLKDADDDEDVLENIKIDKEAFAKQVEEGSYDVGLHFSKKLAFELQVKSKAKSYQILVTKSKSQKTMLKLFVSYHANQVYQYKYELN